MKQQTKSMTEGSPIKLILAFAAPMLLGNLFQQMYNWVDTAVVGRYVSADALASVGSTTNIIMFTTCLCFGLTNGAGIIIAQCFGAKEYGQMKRTIGTMIYVIGAVAMVLLSCGIILAPNVLRLLSTPEEIIPGAVMYMRIVMAGAPLTMTYNACAAIMRNMGNSKTPLVMLIISSVINICLDLFFVIGLGWGIAGVAAATIIAQTAAASACVMYMYRNRKALHLDGLRICAERAAAVQIFRAGVPAALQSSMISIGNMSVMRLINGFGKTTIAAYTAAGKIDSVAIMVVVSMGMALSVYSAQNAGAGHIERIRSGLYKTLALVLGYCMLIAVVLSLFGGRLLTIFIDPQKEPEVIRIGAGYLRIIGIAYFMAGIMRSYQNVVQGTGDVNISMMTGFTELAARVAFSYALVQPLGIMGLWIAIPISWGIGSLVPVVRYYSGKWKSKQFVHA